MATELFQSRERIFIPMKEKRLILEVQNMEEIGMSLSM
jgi:hypothetical protein